MVYRKFTVGRVVPVLCLLGAVNANLAWGSLVYEGVLSGKGAGIGASNVVLTIQHNPSEQGCVGWNGSANVIGSGACPTGLTPAITGGDEKTAQSQTGTQTVAATGVQGGSSIVVILNIQEPAGGSITIENISLTAYSPTGSVLYNSGNMFDAGTPPGGGLFVQNSFQGQGNLGFGFILDATQAAAISPFICTSAAAAGCGGVANAANANNRLGLAGLLGGTSGGNETFSIADASNVLVVPEPITMLTFGAGLALLAFAHRLRGTARKG
jgi:PEP-CTERM motif.